MIIKQSQTGEAQGSIEEKQAYLHDVTISWSSKLHIELPSVDSPLLCSFFRVVC